MDGEMKRTTYLIDKGFQKRMILNVISLVVLATVITNGIVYGLVAYQQKVSNANLFVVSKVFVPEEDLPVITRTQIVRPAIILSLAVTDVVGTIVILMFMLIYSHRIAGPLYKMEKGLNQIAEGDFNVDMKLRTKDEFKGLADSFNDMVTALKNNITTTKQGVSALKRAIPAQANKELLDRIAEIEQNLNKFSV
jgi:methyl-accepting chemotaxis protein